MYFIKKGKYALGTNTTWLGFGKDPGLGYITMIVVVVKRNQMLALSSEQEMNSSLGLMVCLPIQPPYLLPLQTMWLPGNFTNCYHNTSSFAPMDKGHNSYGH